MYTDYYGLSERPFQLTPDARFYFSSRTHKKAMAYLGYGIAFLFLGNVLINMAVNVGLLPTKGLTLPFLSYGGSSLIMCLVMVAVLLRIDIEHHQQQQPRAGARPL